MVLVQATSQKPCCTVRRFFLPPLVIYTRIKLILEFTSFELTGIFFRVNVYSRYVDAYR
jgi:hypothetical protein